MIDVHITTALDKAHIGGVATGSQDFTADESSTWYPWFDLPAPEELWNQLQSWWGVTNGHAPLADVRFDGAAIGGSVYSIDQGWIDQSIPQHPSHVAAAPAHPQAAIGFTKQAALLDHHTFHNGLPDSSKVKESASLSLDVKQSVSSEWSKETSIGGSVSVGVKVGVEGAGDVETSATFSWETKVGESHSQSQELGAGETTEVEVELEYPDWALGMFGAYLGQIQATVQVDAHLYGGITFATDRHHWISMRAPNGDTIPVHKFYVPWTQLGLMKHPGWTIPPTARAAALTIKVGWYADSRVEVVPLKDGTDASITDALNKAMDTPRSPRLTHRQLGVPL